MACDVPLTTQVCLFVSLFRKIFPRLIVLGEMVSGGWNCLRAFYQNEFGVFIKASKPVSHSTRIFALGHRINTCTYKYIRTVWCVPGIWSRTTEYEHPINAHSLTWRVLFLLHIVRMCGSVEVWCVVCVCVSYISEMTSSLSSGWYPSTTLNQKSFVLFSFPNYLFVSFSYLFNSRNKMCNSLCLREQHTHTHTQH